MYAQLQSSHAYNLHYYHRREGILGKGYTVQNQRLQKLEGSEGGIYHRVERNIEELEKEKKFIFECASHYGVFLDQNAMIPYNDSFSDYLDMLIKEEEMKEKVIRDDKRIAELKESKQAYEQQKEIITKSIQSSSDSDKKELYMDRIFEMKEKLCSLKHNGNTLKEALGIVK